MDTIDLVRPPPALPGRRRASLSRRSALAACGLLAIVLLAPATQAGPGTAPATSPVAAANATPSPGAAQGNGPQVPATIVQGGLLQGRLPGAIGLDLVTDATTAIRLSADGGFVLGVGRDDAGPLRLRARFPGGATREWSVAVVPRAWRLERIEGVPEATVNPPPDIAARIAREQADVAAARQRDDAREDYAGGFDWPVRGRVSGVYGSQRIYNGTPKSPHSGLDVAVPTGTPVHAPAAGVVVFARPDLYLTGGTVLLDHGHGLSSNFLHLSRIDVHVGQRVEKGAVLGLVGMTGRATGPHMHWGMNWFATRIDPALLLPASDPAAAAAAAPSR